MRFFAVASVAIAALAQMATALPSPPAAADLGARTSALSLAEAQVILAGFETQIPGLSADIQNMGSLAGIANGGEQFILSFTGEVTDIIRQFEDFIVQVEASLPKTS